MALFRKNEPVLELPGRSGLGADCWAYRAGPACGDGAPMPCTLGGVDTVESLGHTLDHRWNLEAIAADRHRTPTPRDTVPELPGTSTQHGTRPGRWYRAL